MALPANAAVIAERFARLRAGHLNWRRGRRAEAEALAAALADAPLAELVKHIRPRVWITTSLHLAGWSLQQIADVLGYSQQCSVAAVLKRPEAQRLIALVRQAQLEQVLQGRFSVAAQAKAAAPDVMAHLTELAGARKDTEGTRCGRARRDADAIRAADLVLTVSGDKVERRADLHLHAWLEELSDAELETFASSGVVPERYASVAGFLMHDATPSSCSAPRAAHPPTLQAPAIAPDESPTRQARGRR
jgi:lambda repressor-like predicted transcriptional regulator